jgi:hypothetical protein
MPSNRRPARPNKRQQASRSTPESRRASASIVEPIVPVARVVYGKAMIVAEDAAKNTFYFDGSAWMPYSDSIAECRRTCLVKELPQKLKNMTRYEIRRPE